MIRRFRIWKAQRRLARLLEQRKATFEHQDYLKRRKAALQR